MCSIYGCYSSDECNFYKITMDNSECSFEQSNYFKPWIVSLFSLHTMKVLRIIGYTGINSLTTVLLIQNTLQDYWISQTLTNSLQTTTSTISHQTLTGILLCNIWENKNPKDQVYIFSVFIFLTVHQICISSLKALLRLSRGSINASLEVCQPLVIIHNIILSFNHTEKLYNVTKICLHTYQVVR